MEQSLASEAQCCGGSGPGDQAKEEESGVHSTEYEYIWVQVSRCPDPAMT
jgi:hypothetical protein